MLSNLIAEMARKNISNSDIASCIDCTERTVRNKIDETTAFTYSEAIKIRNTFFPNLETEYLFVPDSE